MKQLKINKFRVVIAQHKKFSLWLPSVTLDLFKSFILGFKTSFYTKFASSEIETYFFRILHHFIAMVMSVDGEFICNLVSRNEKLILPPYVDAFLKTVSINSYTYGNFGSTHTGITINKFNTGTYFIELFNNIRYNEFLLIVSGTPFVNIFSEKEFDNFKGRLIQYLMSHGLKSNPYQFIVDGLQCMNSYLCQDKDVELSESVYTYVSSNRLNLFRYMNVKGCNNHYLFTPSMEQGLSETEVTYFDTILGLFKPIITRIDTNLPIGTGADIGMFEEMFSIDCNNQEMYWCYLFQFKRVRPNNNPEVRNDPTTGRDVNRIANMQNRRQFSTSLHNQRNVESVPISLLTTEGTGELGPVISRFYPTFKLDTTRSYRSILYGISNIGGILDAFSYIPQDNFIFYGVIGIGALGGYYLAKNYLPMNIYSSAEEKLLYDYIYNEYTYTVDVPRIWKTGYQTLDSIISYFKPENRLEQLDSTILVDILGVVTRDTSILETYVRLVDSINIMGSKDLFILSSNLMVDHEMLEHIISIKLSTLDDAFCLFLFNMLDSFENIQQVETCLRFMIFHCSVNLGL